MLDTRYSMLASDSSLLAEHDVVTIDGGADLAIVNGNGAPLVRERLVIVGFHFRELILVVQHDECAGARAGPELFQFSVERLLGEIERGARGLNALAGGLDVAGGRSDAQSDVLLQEFEVLFVAPVLQPGGARVAPTLGKRQRNADLYTGGLGPAVFVRHHAAARGEILVVSGIPIAPDEIHLR